MSTLTRETRETRIRIALAGPDEPGRKAPTIRTDDDFLTHMLVTLARYAGWTLDVEATGDLRHHLIEDVAITLGAVVGRDTPAACARYGEATVPMDEALVQVALDAGGRAHFEGELPSSLYEHFLRSFALNAGWTVHVRVVRGRDPHHVVEAAFKALGLTVRQALAETGDVFSTKGSVATEWGAEGDGPPPPDGQPSPGVLDEAGELGPGGENAG